MKILSRLISGACRTMLYHCLHCLHDLACQLGSESQEPKSQPCQANGIQAFWRFAAQDRRQLPGVVQWHLGFKMKLRKALSLEDCEQLAFLR